MGDIVKTEDRRLDAERAVIGSLLLDEQVAGQILASVDPRDFLTAANRSIFQAARAALRGGDPVDPVTIRGKLGGELTDYMMQLMEITPTAANWEAYARIMREEATASRLRELAQQLATAPTLDDARPLVTGMTELLAERQQTPAWTMADVLRYFADNQAAKAPPDYISYGIREIDEGSYTEPGDVVILGGYPSDGKTAFALALAYHMAQKHRVGFFSLETGPKKLADRLASHALQISFDDIKRRTMTESDWTRLANANADFTGRNLTFLSASGQSVAEITATSQAMGFDIILIDYVQLIKPALWRRYSTDASAMAGISMDLHTWAQRTGTLVIELAQLTRPQKQGKWREPDMHDLKESGQFEQDADTIFLLFSPKPGGDYDPDKSRIIKIAKNKEGRRGRWPLYFDGEHQTFSVMAGADGRAIARKYSDAARRNKALGQIHGQQQFVETTDDRNMPF